MATMYFLKELQDFLNKNRVIYTVRRYRYHNIGESDIVYIPNVGGCKRTLFMAGVEYQDLDHFYKESGFDTQREWWDKIKYINRNYPKVELYMYRVDKLR